MKWLINCGFWKFSLNLRILIMTSGLPKTSNMDLIKYKKNSINSYSTLNINNKIRFTKPMFTLLLLFF